MTCNIIIIGNGFDLAHGLKTSYNDFIQYEALQNLESKLFTRASHLPTVLSGEINDLITNQNIRISNRLLSSIYQNNSLFKNNWGDIEYEYFRIFSENYRLKDVNFPDQSRLHNLRTTNRLFSEIKESFIEYIIGIKKEIQENTHIQTLLKNIYRTGKENQSHNLVLNFNYTNTFEIYRDDNCLVFPIHGTANPESRNSVIFGYGDESTDIYDKISEYNLNELMIHFKSFGYSQNECFRDFFRRLGGQSYHVHIFGHSCGLSDRVFLKEIFDKESCEEISIYYHNRPDRSNNYNETYMNISRHFSSTNKHSMRKKIHSFESSKSLNTI